MTLDELLRGHPQIFQIIAQAWLDQGASTFALLQDEQPLANWVNEAIALRANGHPGVSANIQIEGRIAGRLHANGLSLADAQQRLEADAALISGLAPLARDLYCVSAELVNSRDQLLAIYHLASTGRGCLEVEQTLQNLVHQLPPMVRTAGAFALLKVQDESPRLVQDPPETIEDAFLQQLLQKMGNHEHLLYNEIEREAFWPESVRSVLVMRVGVRGAAQAALGLINKFDGPFLMPDIKLMQSIAAYAGAQLENVLFFQENMRLARLETEMALAQQVQISLLPKEPPSIEGLDIWATSLQSSLVGGDFYDFIVRPGLPMTFAVGDLSGKGFPAALLMSMTRTVLRTEMNVFSTPEGILRGVNSELYDDFTRLSSFATLFIGQYFPSRHELHYANAGHSPVIFCPASRPAEMLIADGTAMGILPDSQSQAQFLGLGPGDVLLVGTDGLVEARDQSGRRFGYQQMIDLATSLTQLSAREIADTIFQTVASYSAGLDQEDDQTLVVIKCIQ